MRLVDQIAKFSPQGEGITKEFSDSARAAAAEARGRTAKEHDERAAVHDAEAKTHDSKEMEHDDQRSEHGEAGDKKTANAHKEAMVAHAKAAQSHEDAAKAHREAASSIRAGEDKNNTKSDKAWLASKEAFGHGHAARMSSNKLGAYKAIPSDCDEDDLKKDWSDAAREASAAQRARADKSADNALKNLDKKGHTTIGHFEDDGNNFAYHVIDKNNPHTQNAFDEPDANHEHPLGRLAQAEPEEAKQVLASNKRYHVISEFTGTYPGGPTWKDQGRFTQLRGSHNTMKEAVAEHVGEHGSMRSDAMRRKFGVE